MTNDINHIKSKAEALFLELGFKKLLINEEIIYEIKGSYHKFTYVRGLGGFTIETADSLKEAQNNQYEDGDIYSISLGENEILNQLRKDLNKYYL